MLQYNLIYLVQVRLDPFDAKRYVQVPIMGCKQIYFNSPLLENNIIIEMVSGKKGKTT